MSFGALTLKVSGTIMPASASTSPTKAKGGENAVTGATLVISWDEGGTATAGQKLYASISYNANTQTPTAAGWTQVPGATITISGSNRVLALFTKTSDGTETGITFNLGASAACAGTVTAWNGGKTGTVSSGQFFVNAVGKPFGPSDSPVSSMAVPLMLLALASAATASISSPWTLKVANGAANAMYAIEPAPSAPASGMLTLTSGSLNAVWMNLWIEPA